MDTGYLRKFWAFSAQSVFDHFDIAPDKEPATAAALKAVFDYMRDQPTYASKEGDVKNFRAFHHMVDRLQYRMDAIKKFEDSFFRGKHYDMSAMKVAIICDELLDPDKKDSTQKYLKGFDKVEFELLNRAYRIADKAWEYVIDRNTDKGANIEGLFAANIIAIDMMKKLNIDVKTGVRDACDIEAFSGEFYESFSTLWSPGTIIGRHLLTQLCDMPRQIQKLPTPIDVANLLQQIHHHPK